MKLNLGCGRNYREVYGFKPWNDVKVETDVEGFVTVTMRK